MPPSPQGAAAADDAGGLTAPPLPKPNERPSVTKRDSILAGLDKLDDGSGKKPEPKPTGKPEPKPETRDDDRDEDDADAGDDKKLSAKDLKADKKPEPKVASDDTSEDLDPETQKKLSVIQRAEKRSKDELARQRDELKAEAKRTEQALEREWRPKIEAAQKIEKLVGRARRDADALIEMLDLKPDELEPLAQAIYVRSPKAKTDPNAKAAADRALKEREHRDEVATLRSRLDEMEKASKADKEASAVERQVGQYLDRIVKKVGDETPLVKELLAKNPSKTRERLRKVAAELAEQLREEHGDGAELPEPADVVRALEARRKKKTEKRSTKMARIEDSFFERYGLDGAALRAKKTGGEKTKAGSKSVTGPDEKKPVAKDSKSARADILANWPAD